MTQEFKNIYFSDFPAESSKKKNLTLAFGNKDAELYRTIKTLSSHELRELIGHPSFHSLETAAVKGGVGINPYCLHLLRKRLASGDPKNAQYELTWMEGEAKSVIEPIQATFRGGQKEPLHDWYPYLEGYSPRFVEQVLEEFAAGATSVLDPFAGTGTTALTASKMGRRAFFCELNPLLQYLIEAKVLALSLSSGERKHLSCFLRKVGESFELMLRDAAPDIELQISYSRTFGQSRFFDSGAYQDVLCARTVIDQLACTEPIAAKLLTVAALSSLIEISQLIRRGDLRFRTKRELGRGSVTLQTTLRNRLSKIADDLEQTRSIANYPMLVCEDARGLAKLPALGVDAIVTSPPYVNGTNYFRNTKLELWFLRCLRTANDLSEFRRKAVTAGINDVTRGKGNAELRGELKSLVARLASSAYDSRIPRMVASYFEDMSEVFSAARGHLNPNAKVIIDIGDSAYSGVHVPTHDLLTSILESQGYVLEREVTLRKRISRGQLPLRQILLVFQYRRRRGIPTTLARGKRKAGWDSAWKTFKETLPHQKNGFAKRNWGNSLHSLCSYQGKMKPSLASHLVRTFVSKGGSMLDPFAGVGTIPFEAALQGVKTYAFEISPTALNIATAKLAKPSVEECEVVLKSLQRFILQHTVGETAISSARAIRFNGSLADYFERTTFHEVLLARQFFKINPPQNVSASLVLASLLHILHGNRPYALSRRSHPITPFAPSGEYEYRALMPRVREKVRRSLDVEYPTEFVDGKVFHQDATSWWPHEVDQLDAIITSPPFFDSTRFYLANWMRLWFCGWEAEDFKTRPLAFVDERQKRGFNIYEPIFRQAKERLKPNGVLVLHLGKSKKCNMADSLTQVSAPWFRVADVFTENVSHCESHGIRDKGTVTDHQYLILQ